MSLIGKKIIVCHENSDVKSLVVGGGQPGHLVLLNVNDADSDDSADGRPLIAAQLLPSQAIALARALLRQAGIEGRHNGNRHEFTFVD